MATLKRKFNELEDSDSEDFTFGKQILPVADLPNDFDGEPMDGMQYLFTVRRDAKSLPHVTRVANPFESNPAPPASNLRQSPHPALPSNEWRELTEIRWKNLRKNFDQPTIGTSLPLSPQKKLMPDKKERDLWWDFLSGKPESVWNRSRRQSKKKMKQAKAKQSQYQYNMTDGMRSWNDQKYEHGEDVEQNCDYGQGQSHENSILAGSVSFAVPKDENETEATQTLEPRESLPTPVGTPTPPDEPEHAIMTAAAVPDTNQDYSWGAFTPREPSPRLVKLIDERTSLHLLMYFTHWINLHVREPDSPYCPTNAHARWIFALLLRIDDCISADDMSLLRNLARACLSFLKTLISKQTKGVPPESGPTVERVVQDLTMNEQACWIIISGIAGIWGQRDLWMDAEDALASI